MAGWIRSGGVLPDERLLKRDLCAPTYAFNSANRMLLERKEEMKKRGLPSPDLADALALTFAHPVRPKLIRGAGSSFVEHDYNPFE